MRRKWLLLLLIWSVHLFHLSTLLGLFNAGTAPPICYLTYYQFISKDRKLLVSIGSCSAKKPEMSFFGSFSEDALLSTEWTDYEEKMMERGGR